MKRVKINRFQEWLIHQTCRDDSVGCIAKEVVCDAARSSKTIPELLKDRLGGDTEEFLKKDYFLEKALAEFQKRTRGVTVYHVNRGDPDENFETARQLNAIALFHGVDLGIIPTGKDAPLKEASFDFFTRQGFRCHTILKVPDDNDPILRTWFNIGDCDVLALKQVEDSEILHHCDAVVEMFIVRESSTGIIPREEPTSWIYDLELLDDLKKWFPCYANEFKEHEPELGGSLWLKS